MNFMEEEEEEKGYSCNNEEEEDQISKFNPFSSNSASSSPSSNYKSFVHHHHHNQNLRLGSFDSRPDYNNNSNLEFMDLSLGNNTIAEEPSASSTGGGDSSSSSRPIEKEHMFDKVVTPSDVGKLNRLVIPKQHAEKYFPLDSSSNEKGLLLNFEDRTGKSWRFRYSYWNSSQSYVMTKGWSRFVKEKKLDAGDVVSFQRGVGELGKGRLYIDWRRRPEAPDPASLAQLQFQNQLHFQQSSVRWGRLYPLPQSLPVPRNYEHLQRLNYSNTYPYPYQHHHHHHPPQQQHQQMFSYGSNHSNIDSHNNTPVLPQYYLRPISHQIGSSNSMPPPLVIDSVPVVHHHHHGNHKTSAKRLRLFGVNMDCPIQDDQSSGSGVVHGKVMSSIPPNLGSSWVSNPPGAIPTTERDDHQSSNKGKSSTSLSFDLDL